MTDDARPEDETDVDDDTTPNGDDERSVDRVDPDAPGRSLFDDGDAVEPNEPA